MNGRFAARVTTAVVWVCALSALWSFLAVAQANAAEPSAWSPPGARVFDWGGATRLQGVPVALRGFVSDDSPDAVAAAARRHRPGAVESRHGEARVLGWFDAGHHTTLRIDPAPGGGSRGVWSTAPLDAALRASALATAAPAWAPAGSRPGLDLSTRTADRTARVSLALNEASPEANASHVVASLTAEGLRLERRSQSAAGEAVVLHFSGPRGERAVIAIVRQTDGQTALTRILDGPGRALP